MDIRELCPLPPLPKIYRNLQASSRVSEYSAVAIRQMFKNGICALTISKEMKLEKGIVDAVLDGATWSFAGGPLRPVSKKQGLLDQGFAPNVKRFLKGVLKIAKDYLPEEQFVIVCEFNGLTRSEATEAQRRVKSGKQLGDLLRLHAEENRITKIKTVGNDDV